MATAEIIVKIVDQTAGGLSGLTRQLSNFDRNVSATNRNLGSMSNALGRIAGAAAAAFGGVAVANAGMAYADLRDIMNRLTGDVEAGAAAMANIRDVTENTIFSFDQVSNSMVSFMANGVDPAIFGVDNLNELLILMSDTATLTTDKVGALEAMTQLYTRAANGAGVSVEELDRLAERGIPVYEILTDRIGLTRNEVTEFGKNSAGASRIIRELNAGLEESFSGATADRADNLSQAMSNFGVATQGLSAAFMERLEPALARFVTLTNNVLKSLEPVAYMLGTALGVAINAFVGALELIEPAIAPILVAFAAWRAVGLVSWVTSGTTAILSMVGVFPQLVAGLRTVTQALRALTLSNPFTAIAMAAVAAAVLIIDNWDTVKAWFGTFVDYMQVAMNRVRSFFLNAFNLLPFVDLQDEIDETNQRFEELISELNTTADAADDTADSVDNAADSLDNAADSADDTANSVASLTDLLRQGDNAWSEYASAIERNTHLSGLSNEEREVQIELERALEALARARGQTIDELSARDRAQTEQYVRGQLEQQQANEARERSRQDFNTQTERLLQRNYEETTSLVTRLEQEKQDYLRTARELGLEHHVDTMDAMLEYDRQIIQAQIEERQRYIDETKSEYSNLYSFLGDKLMDMTGLTRREFGLMNDVAKLVFGVDIPGVLDGMFAAGISAITGLRTGGQQQFEMFPGIVRGPMTQVGNTINTTFASTGLTAVGNFVTHGFDLMVAFASDLGGVFGSLGNSILDAFSGLFGGIGSGIRGLFNQLSTGAALGSIGGNRLGGSIGYALGNAFFGPVGGVIGGIFGGFFNEGGYIKPGQIGIAGERGPEIISGPANVVSTRDTADIFGGMRGGTNINVTFNVNTIDSRGFEQLLYDNRQPLANMFRSAIENRPNQTLRGVY